MEVNVILYGYGLITRRLIHFKCNTFLKQKDDFA